MYFFRENRLPLAIIVIFSLTVSCRKNTPKLNQQAPVRLHITTLFLLVRTALKEATPLLSLSLSLSLSLRSNCRNKIASAHLLKDDSADTIVDSLDMKKFQVR